MNSQHNNPIEQYIQHVQSTLNELAWYNGDTRNTGAVLEKLHLILTHIAKMIKTRKITLKINEKAINPPSRKRFSLGPLCEPQTMMQLESYLDTIKLQTYHLTQAYKQSQLANKINNTIVSLVGSFLVSQLILDHSSETLWPTIIAITLLIQSQFISNTLSTFLNSDSHIQPSSTADNISPRLQF